MPTHEEIEQMPYKIIFQQADGLVREGKSDSRFHTNDTYDVHYLTQYKKTYVHLFVPKHRVLLIVDVRDDKQEEIKKEEEQDFDNYFTNNFFWVRNNEHSPLDIEKRKASVRMNYYMIMPIECLNGFKTIEGLKSHIEETLAKQLPVIL